MDLKRPWLTMLVLPIILMFIWGPLTVALLEILRLATYLPITLGVVISAVFGGIFKVYKRGKISSPSLFLITALIIMVQSFLAAYLHTENMGNGESSNFLVRFTMALIAFMVVWYGIYTCTQAMLDSAMTLSYHSVIMLIIILASFLTGKPLVKTGLIAGTGGLILIGFLPYLEVEDKNSGGIGWWALLLTSFTLWLVGTGLLLTLNLNIPSMDLGDKWFGVYRGAATRGSMVTNYNSLTNFDVGGELAYDNRIFMTVKSLVPSYWRGESYDLYTGGGWKKTLSVMSQVDSIQPLGGAWVEGTRGRKVKQRFNLAEETTTNLVFTGYQPIALNLPVEHYLIDEAFNIYLEQPFANGASYEVKVKVPGYGVSDLQKAKFVPDDSMKVYLQLPDQIPQRVRNLALQLASNQETDYDKVKAIEGYLRQNYPYTLQVQSTPEGRDMVDYFLHDQKKGYCIYHSSAMVVMVRALGIPARWVTGFTTGTLNPTSNEYEIRNTDAHAWVEVYFAGYGWVPFEPTASFTLPDQRMERQNKAQPASAQGTDRQSSQNSKESSTRDLGLGFAFIGLIAAVGIWLGLKKLIPFLKEKHVQEEFSPIQLLYMRMLKLLAAKGYPKEMTQTPKEYVISLRERIPSQIEGIQRITDEYLVSRYGGRNHSLEEILGLEQLIISLEKELKKWSG